MMMMIVVVMMLMLTTTTMTMRVVVVIVVVIMMKKRIATVVHYEIGSNMFELFGINGGSLSMIWSAKLSMTEHG